MKLLNIMASKNKYDEVVYRLVGSFLEINLIHPTICTFNMILQP